MFSVTKGEKEEKKKKRKNVSYSQTAPVQVYNEVHNILSRLQP